MMVRLYYSSFSDNCRKVHLALEEVGADYEIVHMDLRRGDQKRAEYVELNPNAKVPTLVDGDFVLWESNAILGYLAEKYPAVGLLPADRLVRARVYQMLFWQATRLGPAVGGLRRLMLQPEGSRDAATMEQARGELGRALGILSGIVAPRSNAIDDVLTIADLALGPNVENATALGVSVPAGLGPWFESLRGRRSWSKVFTGSPVPKSG